ncbi:kappa-type opioid receptor-like [Amphiura filiformis]|uniref:kappa-type opioid receptor-like n=1 Tax=Amphiura filiformis TaxID=82378 RepID=UPI003B214E98
MNTSNIAHEEELDLEAHHIMVIISNSLIFIIGIPGNALIIRVYAAKKSTSSARVLIISLAINDLLVCLLRPLRILQYIPIGLIFKNRNILFCVLSETSEPLVIFSSVVLTAAISIDRYFAVCKPLKRLGVMTPNKAKCIVGLCVLLSLLATVPIFFMFGIKESVDHRLMCAFTAPDWAKTMRLLPYYIVIITSLIITVIMYFKVILTIRQQAKVHPQPPTRSPRRERIQDMNISTVSSVKGVSTQRTPQHRQLDIPTAESSVAGHSGRASPHLMAQLSIASNSTVTGTDSQLTVLAYSNHSSLNNSIYRKVESKTTKMLLLTTLFFIISWIPAVIYYIVPSALRHEDNFDDNPGAYALLQFFHHEAFLINSAVNPFLYSFANKRFREDCLLVIRRVLFCKK